MRVRELRQCLHEEVLVYYLRISNVFEELRQIGYDKIRCNRLKVVSIDNPANVYQQLYSKQFYRQKMLNGNLYPRFDYNRSSVKLFFKLPF